MVFRGSKKVLFDTAYHAYRDIIKQTESVYAEIKDQIEDLDEELRRLPIIALSVDIYLQVNLYKIAIADNRISDDEKYFIRTVIDNLELLKKIPKYKAFVTRLDESSFDKIKDDNLCGDKNIPAFIEMCLLYDRYKSTQVTYKVINELEVIFNSLIDLDDIQSVAEKKTVKAETKRLMVHAIEISKMPLDEKKDDKIDEETDDATLEELLSELNSLVGLYGVKKDIADTINLIRVNEMRKSNGLKAINVSHHLVFTGSPGTGKTTVARLVARIYRVLGVVKKGNFVETDRSGLVAGYIGHTAVKTKEMVDKAIGGVLFIDEAYSLANNSSGNDFGHEAVDTLVKAMEDHKDDLVVIVAGYEKEMMDFINSNPGLPSRFSRYIKFENYSIEELSEIFKSMCAKNGFTPTEDAIIALEKLLDDVKNPEGIGNARGIRNIFEKAMLNQAGRVLNINNPCKDELNAIVSEDIPTVEMFGLKKKEKKKIGFCN